MKLISLLTQGHDNNMSYFDGENLKYFKFERTTQIKHHKVNDLKEFSKYLKILWNTSFEEVDDICFCGYSRESFESKVEFNDKLNRKVYILDHHYAHALSVSLFDSYPADVSIVIDGQGGINSWVVYVKNELTGVGRTETVGSIGHGIQWLGTQFEMMGNGLDFPGKIMGLQSYGQVDLEFLNKLQKFDMNSIGVTMTRVEKTRPPEFHTNDGLFSFQHWIDHKNNQAYDTKIDWIRTLHERCGQIILEFFKQYCNPDDVIHYSGGVAQNVIWNTLLKKHFKNLVILPHCSDEGLSLGGIEFLRKKHNLPKFKVNNFPYIQSDELTDTLNDDIIRKTAKLLAEGKVVAYYQGNGEIGPRALGNRSILMDPRISNGKDIINKVKNREYYRPFGASILSEHAKEYFDLDFENPYMLYVGVTQKDNLQSITHVDGTCRVQTVETGHFRKLLEYFYELTDCPVLLNTSLNVSGKPIAGHISDAVQEFNNKDIDVLVIGNKIVIK